MATSRILLLAASGCSLASGLSYQKKMASGLSYQRKTTQRKTALGTSKNSLRKSSFLSSSTFSSSRSSPCSKIKDKEEHQQCCLEQKNPLSASQKEYTVELKNFQNVQYYGDITIGSDGKEAATHHPHNIFPAIYDTGSFEILVLSGLCEQCQSDNYDEDTPLYESKQSGTFSLFKSSAEEKRAEKELKQCMKEVESEASDDECVYQTVEAQHVFGSGPVESQRGYETVRIGSKLSDGKFNFENSPTLPRFPFWQIKRHQIEAWEAGAKFSAIVGLGPRDHVPDMGGGDEGAENSSDENSGTEEENSDETENSDENAENADEVPTLLDRADVNKFSICLQRSTNQVVLPGASEETSSSEEASDHAQMTESWPSGYLTFNAHTPQTEKLVEVVGQVHWAVKMHNFGAKVGGSASSGGGGMTQQQIAQGVKQPEKDDSGKVNLCSSGGCAAIIDSGTSLIAAPRAAIEGLVTELNILEDCSNMKSLPNLEFSFGEGEQTEFFSLPPSAYVMRVSQLKETTGIWDWLLAEKRTFKEETICVPAFMPLDKESDMGPVFIMGMSFLRHYKTTYVRAIKSCEPKMYFTKVDAKCNKIDNSLLHFDSTASHVDSTASHVDSRSTASERQHMENYMPMQFTAGALENAKLPRWAVGKGKIGI